MSDGPKFEAAWLQCRVSSSFKPDEARVRVLETNTPEPPTFFVAKSLVDPKPGKVEAPGRVRVTLRDRRNGTSVVEVPGEPLSYGPVIEVPSNLLT
jgi:hypothetical protein